MPTERDLKRALATLKKRNMWPTPYRVAALLKCLPCDLPPLPLPTVDQVKKCAATLDFPSIDGISKKLGAPYQMVRKLYIEAGLPLLKRGRPPIENKQETDLILNWYGTDTALAEKLGMTKEAVRQKRNKLGKQLESKEWKQKAIDELKAGVRPSVVAVKYGYTVGYVENLANDL